MTIDDTSLEDHLEPAETIRPPFGYCDAITAHTQHVHTGIDQLDWECPGLTTDDIQGFTPQPDDGIARDFDGVPIPRAFCDVPEIHERHCYVAINGTVYDCPGLDAATLAELGAYDPGTCGG